MQLKFIFVAYEMRNTFLDHMQMDLGRYLLWFGRAHQMSQVSQSAQLSSMLPSRLYKSGAQTKNGKYVYGIRGFAMGEGEEKKLRRFAHLAHLVSTAKR